MQKLESDRIGKIVKQPRGYDSFIPDALYPDGPKITLDPECISLLSDASRCLGELKGITELLPDPDLFVAFYVRKEALLSSQIEGTQCSLDEVIQVDEKSRTAKPVDEVVNYINAMNFGLQELERIPMSLRLIHQIHEKLLENVRGKEKTPGEFKKYQNWVGPPGCLLQEAAYVPPPPDMTLELMWDFEKYYHVENHLPPLIKTAVLHSHFETIHPYADGNGRLGRLLITFMLCEKKIIDRPVLYLSLFFKENRSKYYESLMDIRFKGKWEEWIKFFLYGVRSTSLEASKTARDVLKLQAEDRAKIGKNMSKHKISFACYDLICKKPIISIPEVIGTLKNVTYPTVKKVFDGFMGQGILTPYGIAKRNKLFQYGEYLNILRRGT